MKRAIDFRSLLAGGAGALALAISTAPPSLAQTIGRAAAEADGDVVVIIGQTLLETLPQELEKYGSDVEVTGIEEIRNAGFTDVSQALQMDTPGLFLAPRGGPFSYLDISLQGSRTQDILFLVDGVRVNNRLYSTTVTDTLPASMVERIEVLKGGQSLFYGTQAAAGVINIVTRGYTDEFNGLLRVGGDTNEGFLIDGYLRGRAGPGNYVLYGSQNKAEGFDTFTRFEPSATDHTRSYDVKEIGGKYRIELGDRLALDGRISHVNGRLDYPSVRGTAYAENKRDEDLASLGINYTATDWAELIVKGYWYNWDSHYTTISNTVDRTTGAITGQSLDDDNLFWGFEDYGVNALAKLTPHKGFEYLVGYDYQQYSGRDDVLLIAQQKEKVNAVFAQVRTTPDLIENAAFAAGVRHDETSRSSKTVWNVSGRYDFTPRLYVQGIVGTSFLLPTAEQLFAIDPFDPLGNPNLEPEQSESANLSVGGAFDAGPVFQWQATYFARNIDNLIGDRPFSDPTDPNLNPPVLDPLALYPNAPDPDPSTPENEIYDNGLFFNVPGEVKVRGFELLGSADLGNGFAFNASYTHSESEQEDAGGGTSDLQRIPTDYAKVGGSYESASGRWGLDTHVLWTGEQRANVTGFGSVNYGDYIVVDLAGHVFIDADQHHKLTVRLENAFDEDYVTRVNSSVPDISANPRFLFGNRGVPQTLHVTYSYGF